MQGQWLGQFEGDTPGQVVVDLDERKDRFTGTALFIPRDTDLPDTVAFVDTITKEDAIKITVPIAPIEGANRVVLTAADLVDRYPHVNHSSVADISLERSEKELIVSFVTSVSEASGKLRRFPPTEVSVLKPPTDKISWQEFKEQVAELPLDDFVWRGQAKPWSLQTSFHRTGRLDMYRYVHDDVPKLQTAILPHTKAFMDLNSPPLTAGLYNLAQHHGFPTPVLDWTYSPYVAAFFALRNANSSDRAPRILGFDKSNWPQSLASITHLALARPHVTIMELPPIDNPRSISQQAVAMVTNLENIEAFIAYHEKLNKDYYLLAFDLRPEDRDEAMQDLRRMGITAASMFPGLDGTCEELRHRLF